MKIFIFCPCLIFFFKSSSISQDLKLIAYEEAIELSLKNNVEINKQKVLFNIADVNNRLAHTGYIPNVGLTNSYAISEGRQFDQTKGAITTNTIIRDNININVSIDLIDYARRIYVSDRTRNQLAFEKESLSRLNETIRFAISQQYLQIILDKKILEIARENYSLQEKLLEKIVEFSKLGIKSTVDVFIQQSNLKSNEISLAKAENQLISDKLALAEMIHLTNDDWDIVEPRWDLPDSLEVFSTSLEEYIAIAKKKRKDVKAMEAIESSLKSEIAVSNHLFSPSITAYYNYGTNYSSLLLPRTFVQQVYQDNIYGILGLTVNLPLINGWRYSGQRAISKLRYENMRLQKEHLQYSVNSDVIRSYNDFRTSCRTFGSSTIQLEAATSALEVQKKFYELGNISLWELIQANANYVSASANYSQSYYSLLFQNIFFKYAIGVAE